MSLMSLITTGSSSTSTTSSASTSPLQQLIASEQAANSASTASTTSSAASGNGVTISTAAQIAAAEAADNKKDFTTLSSDTRSALDAQYAAQTAAGKTTTTADLSEFSGRALAAIVLNKTGSFTSKEITAAKAELNTRMRADFTATAGSTSMLSGIAAYNQQLVSQYDSMSDEERQAIGWTPAVRASAASFVATDSQSSLFDQLGDIDPSSSTSSSLSGSGLFGDLSDSDS